MVGTPADEENQSVSFDAFINGRWKDLCVEFGPAKAGAKDKGTRACSLVIL